MVAPGGTGSYTDTLAGGLASGEARPVSYCVELRNKKGRSAGLSNAATVLAGEAPRPVGGLKAEVREAGRGIELDRGWRERDSEAPGGDC